MPKELLVSDESYNTHNIRVLTAGGDFSRFEKNPIMLYNHHINQGKKDDVGPIGTWKLRFAGEKIYGTPFFDFEDEFAAVLAGKYERGIIRSASLGLRILEMSEDGAGAGNYTVTKWQLMEISLCDIPSNENAVAYYGANDEPLELSAVIKLAQETKKDISMKFQNVPVLLGLSAEASDEIVAEKIKSLLNLATENSQMKVELETLKAQVAKNQEQEILALCEKAIAEKRILPVSKKEWLKLFTADFDTTKATLELLPAIAQVKLSAIPSPGDGAGEMKYDGMTFSEMTRKAPEKLAKLKEKDFATFAALYKAEFGKDYKV